MEIDNIIDCMIRSIGAVKRAKHEYRSARKGYQKLASPENVDSLINEIISQSKQIKELEADIEVYKKVMNENKHVIDLFDAACSTALEAMKLERGASFFIAHERTKDEIAQAREQRRSYEL